MPTIKSSSSFLSVESVLPMDSKGSCPGAHATTSDAHLKNTATTSVYVNKKLLTFPEKLMDIIDSEVFRDAIAWTPDGKAFYITPKTFADRILNTHFQGSRFGSFQKKLLRYGFRKRNCTSSPSTIMVFQHDLFVKGKPELLEYITGGKQRESDAKTGRLASKSAALLYGATSLEFSHRNSQNDSHLNHILHGAPCRTAKPYQMNATKTLCLAPSFQFPIPSLTVPADRNSTFVGDHMHSQVSYQWQLDCYRQLAMASLGYHN